MFQSIGVDGGDLIMKVQVLLMASCLALVRANGKATKSEGTREARQYDEPYADNYGGMPYSFSYSVYDPTYYNDYGHYESSDGRVVRGGYRVNLPDGRLQVVNYHVEGDSGYVAHVKYEGEAHYPEYKASYDGKYPEYQPKAEYFHKPEYTYRPDVPEYAHPAYKTDYPLPPNYQPYTKEGDHPAYHDHDHGHAHDGYTKHYPHPPHETYPKYPAPPAPQEAYPKYPAPPAPQEGYKKYPHDGYSKKPDVHHPEPFNPAYREPATEPPVTVKPVEPEPPKPDPHPEPHHPEPHHPEPHHPEPHHPEPHHPEHEPAHYHREPPRYTPEPQYHVYPGHYNRDHHHHDYPHAHDGYTPHPPHAHDGYTPHPPHAHDGYTPHTPHYEDHGNHYHAHGHDDPYPKTYVHYEQPPSTQVGTYEAPKIKLIDVGENFNPYGYSVSSSKRSVRPPAVVYVRKVM